MVRLFQFLRYPGGSRKTVTLSRENIDPQMAGIVISFSVSQDGYYAVIPASPWRLVPYLFAKVKSPQKFLRSLPCAKPPYYYWYILVLSLT